MRIIISILEYILNKLKPKVIGYNPPLTFERPFLRPTPSPAPPPLPPKRIIIEGVKIINR